MWNSTARIAKAVAEGASSKGINVKLFHLRRDPWTDIMTEMLDAKAIAVGSPTMHNKAFPPVAGFLAYMRSLKPINKISVAFGSYGWSGGATDEINKVLEELRFTTLEPLQIRFRPTKEEVNEAFQLGVKIAGKIIST
ncbi:MAG: flavodoxin domain-containing protein [Candidatus Bathyarchaeota archaeon]